MVQDKRGEQNFSMFLSFEELEEALDQIRCSNADNMLREYRVQSPFLRPKDNLKLLLHYRDIQFEMARLVVGWIPSVTQLELKMELGRQAYLFTEIIAAFDARIVELPGKKQSIGKNQKLSELRHKMAQARNEAEFLIGVYHVVQVQVLSAITEHLRCCDTIADFPTIDRLERAVEIIQKQLSWVQKWTQPHLIDTVSARFVKEWSVYVSALLNVSGGIRGDTDAPNPEPPFDSSRTRNACAEPAQLEFGYRIVEEFMFISSRETEGKLSDILYHNFSELFVPDSLAYMIYDVDGMPYDFYRDFIRQIWDECRHTCMGIRELKNLKIDVKKLPLNNVRRDSSYTWLLATIGYTGEGCSFPRKFEAVKRFYEQGIPSAALVTEYDIADEHHHIHYIHRWLPLLHKREGCEQPLKEIIEQAQRDALERWSGANHSVGADRTHAEQVEGQFGSFCRKVDFKIDFSVVQ